MPLVQCKNKDICDPDYSIKCRHAEPHEHILVESLNAPSMLCDDPKIPETPYYRCDPGWSEFSPVICEPITREQEAVYWLKRLYEFIDNNGVTDEEDHEYEGYVVRSRSSEFAALLDQVQIFIHDVPSTSDGK